MVRTALGFLLAPALLAPALLTLFGVWAGTFYGGAGWAGSVTGQVVLLALALGWGTRPGTELDPLRLDPLRLGRAGRWWLAALMATAVASWWVSPVPRAGRVGLLLLPAYLVLPAALAWGWGTEVGRRRGLRALAVVVAAVAGWSLVDHLALGSPRAAAPLGHHNLLAVWLLAVLPLAVLPIRERGLWRWLGVAAGALGVTALLATRSLLGAAGLALLVVLAAVAGWRTGQRPGRQPGRRLGPRGLLALAAALVGIVALLALFGPRLDDLIAGRDTSARARAVYWRAGVAGIAERPLLGWGPGATPWTVAEHLEPWAGVNPPGETVGQLHSQPLQIAYELGLPGLALAMAVGGLFGLRRWREAANEHDTELGTRGGGRDPALAWAGLAGLAASGVAALGTAALEVPAVPVAWAVAAAAALAGGRGAGEERRGHGSRIGFRIGTGLYGLYLLLAAALLLSPARAHFHYDRSLGLDGPAATHEMARAVALDPAFPWYRAWAVELAVTGGGDGGALLARQAAAASALEAARDAPGVAALWLLAGARGAETGAPWAGEALARACRLDPLAPLAPFHLMRWDPDAPDAPHDGARALLAEPRLLAATFWDRRPTLWAATIAEVHGWSGVPDGWKVAFLDTAERLERERLEWERGNVERLEREPSPGSTGLAVVSAALDRDAATSIALHLFRRRPRSYSLAPVTVHRRLAEGVRLPPATTLPQASGSALSARGCEPR